MKKILANKFLTGSMLMLVGVNVYNLGQMIFHLIVGRLLGRDGYAEVAAIVSVLGMVIIVQQAFGLTITRFVSAGKNEKTIINFTRWIFWWSFWLGIVLAVGFGISSPFLINFLHIHDPNILYILIPVIFLLVSLNTAKAIFQGLLIFTGYIGLHITDVVVKLILSIFFISLGWSVFGVMVAIVTGVIFASTFTFLSLKKYIVGSREKKPEIWPIFKYSIPVFFTSVALTSMSSTDIILAKHFFTSDQAGLYAALSKLGSIAFFGAAPVASVMFPYISKNHSKNKPYLRIFYLSLLIVLFISFLVVISYRFLPTLIINSLFGSEFIVGAPDLWWFGIYNLLLGLAVLFIQFYLSIGKTKIVSLFIVAAILQVILICLFHSSFLTIVHMSVLSVTLLVLSLILYFPKIKR